jgi:HD-like signal output (HDOD) protein
MKDKAPVVKQLYRLSIEPRVVEHLDKLATRLGEPRSRLATRIFTDAVLSAKVIVLRTAKGARP